MKILFIGDISGRPGRETIKSVLPEVQNNIQPDLIIANCENAAGGRGITKETLNELQGSGIDYFTSGEHVWGIRQFRDDLYDSELPIVRPYNYEQTDTLPGKGFDVLDLGSKGQIIIGSLIGQTFMREPVRSPFWMFDEMYRELESRDDLDLESTPFILDFHAEATSEKVTLGNYVKDRVSAVLGTHTHVATADNRLMGKTAFVTDVGMVGPLDASLWVEFESVTHNFKYPYKEQFKMAEEGRRVFNSVVVEIEGKEAVSITRFDKVID
ncbi:YmdB family metallophosphoesterase [Candidatus Dojkabacteria bacterium]|uniref:YmdB family metallophosphoesterase n=1 Tax=Candidatus Dojkabacteria bacterium TaxID=2099670 RepID=A0A955L4M0_9BACT|nr:YmdB family metallophosphoesterase [Candidatus Dojkabacteria bacterium]